jgi:5,10-methylenetetrahydromethanopterin reductase
VAKRPAFTTLVGFIPPDQVGEVARRYEGDEWDGLCFVDTQNISPEVYVQLTVAAVNTTRIELGPWVTNPLTRHPAVTAAAIASIDQLTGGRAMLGLGRGDSSLANVGLSPVSVRRMERYLTNVRTYLAGECVPFEELADHGGAPPIKDLPLGHAPESSQLQWLDRGRAPVPVDVVATGPRVIALAAVRSDRLTLALGADVDRLTWAIDVARSARSEAGLDPDALSLGAAVSVVPSDSLELAYSMAAGSVASQARFSVMHGKVVGPTSDEDRKVYEYIAKSYDLNRHGEMADQVAGIGHDFIERFAVVGSPQRCAERLQELGELGLDRIMLYVGNRADSWCNPEVAPIYRDVVQKVLPNV